MDYLRIKELLKEKGTSGKDLAKKLNVSENTISSIVNGKTQPRFQLLEAIANELEVDIKDLFNSTKVDPIETLFVKREGVYIKIGNIKKS